MSFFECRFGEYGRGFDLYVGFSLFEEIENVFVRSFLQGGCLKSAVLDMPFCFDLPLNSESAFGDNGGCYSSYEHYSHENCHNFWGGSDSYFNSVSYSYLNDCYDFRRVYSCAWTFDGDNRYEKGDGRCNRFENKNYDERKYQRENTEANERRFNGFERDLTFERGLLPDEILPVNGLSGVILTANGLSGVIPFVNSSVNGKDHFSPSLILNIYGESDLKAFPSLSATKTGFDISLNREGCNYSESGGFSEKFSECIKTDRFKEALGRQSDLFIGGLGGKVFVSSEKGVDRVSAAERMGKQGIALLNENLEPRRRGMLFEYGNEDIEAHFYRAYGSVFLKDCFDFSQGKNVLFAAFDTAEPSGKFQRAELLWEKSVKADFERLGKLLPISVSDMLSINQRKENGAERGRFFLWEDELRISSEEVRKIRRAALSENCGETVKAEIRVDMSGMKNIINRETDIDSIVTDLTAAVSEAVASAAEGVRGL